MRRLSECPAGSGGRVARVNGHGPVSRRLMELGFVKGTPVQVIRAAPLGDPLEVQLLWYRLCLRRAEAEKIDVG